MLYSHPFWAFFGKWRKQKTEKSVLKTTTTTPNCYSVFLTACPWSWTHDQDIYHLKSVDILLLPNFFCIDLQITGQSAVLHFRASISSCLILGEGFLLFMTEFRDLQWISQHNTVDLPLLWFTCGSYCWNGRVIFNEESWVREPWQLAGQWVELLGWGANDWRQAWVRWHIGQFKGATIGGGRRRRRGARVEWRRERGVSDELAQLNILLILVLFLFLLLLLLLLFLRHLEA